MCLHSRALQTPGRFVCCSPTPTRRVCAASCVPACGRTRGSLLVCRRLQQLLAALAEKHPATKFVQSAAHNCIPNYPDKNLPTIFIYHEDDLKTQFVGPSIFGGESMTGDNVEWALSCFGAVKTKLEADPRIKTGLSKKAPFGIQVSERTQKALDEESDEDSDDA